MARIKDAVAASAGHMKGTKAPAVDLSRGARGQNGPLTDLKSIVANSSYVKRNVIAILMEPPRGFQDLPDKDVWVKTLKNLVELCPQSIEGLTSTLQVEYVENAVGGAGEMQQDVANVTRDRSAPVFVWPEKYGKAVNNFLDGWILNLLGDPETKIPRVMNYAATKPTDLLPDYTGMTVLFIEPDPTHTKVVTSWLCTNMMPMTGGENVGKRDLTAAGEKIDHSIGFTAITQVGEGVNQVAQQELDILNLSTINGNNVPAIVAKVDPTVTKHDAATGYGAVAKTAALAAG